jgi:hypothetical protein
VDGGVRGGHGVLGGFFLACVGVIALRPGRA